MEAEVPGAAAVSAAEAEDLADSAEEAPAVAEQAEAGEIRGGRVNINGK